MHILTVTLQLLVLNIRYVTPLSKCCDADSYLTRNNSIYFCDKDEDKRLQIFTKETNFFKENATSDGTCVDSRWNITEYKFKDQNIVEVNQIDVNFYPKCCPLGYFYDSVAHSCVWKDNIDESFITQKFIRVGLPHCTVIVDYKLSHDNHRMELGNLDIGEGTRFKEGQFCVDRDEDQSLIARGCYENLAVCEGIKCIHKCCPDGQSFVNGQHCKNTYEHGLDLSFSDRVNNSQDPFAIIHKYDCRIYILKKRIQFYIDPDGNFYAFYNKTNSFVRHGIDEKSYCIEHVQKNKLNNFEFFMCFPDKPLQGKFLAARWSKILSCIFIFLTAAVYLYLPEMLNLFGKILVSYCGAMLCNFIFLTYAQFVTERSDQACVISSFLSHYMSLCSFTWLNVMCFDIWWTFGTPKSFVSAIQRKNEIKRFLLYSLYGWGVPTVLTLLSFLAYGVFDTPYVVRPILGTFKCFWERRSGNYAMFLYYVLPLILMEVANLVLFVRTILYCLKVKSEINRMNDNRMSVKERKKSYNVDKEQLALILKLGVTMGISFAFEVVSSLFPFDANSTTMYIEIIWDTINCLQGVFIFLIFICKMKVFRLCKGRFVSIKGRKISVSSLPTGTTQMSAEPLNSKCNIKN